MSNTSRLASITYPNGRKVNLGYGAADSIEDLFSLVKTIAIQGEIGAKVEYTRVGLARFVRIAYPQPDVHMSMIRPGGGSEGDSGDPYDGYDRFSRVQEMRWQKSSDGTILDGWQWGFNEASNRTWKKNLVAASGQDEAYGYDGLYQVIRDAVGTLNTNRTAIGGVPGEEEDFTYDPTGNWLGYRKEANGSMVLDQSRSNNQDNQLTQIDGSSALHSYDRAGNATKLPPGESINGEPALNVIWDAWNRIVRVETRGDDWIHLVGGYSYDGLSRRITRTVDEVTTHTYWSDRWKPLEDRTGSSTTAARSYLWGERPGHRDELILRDRDTNSDGSLDERLYATMDYFNGTAVMNTSGVVQERYAYSAFGVRRIMAADFSPRSTSNFGWDFGFQGQFRDAETGWSNYGYRFYVPLLGRWINRDPIGESGGVDVYGFAANNGFNWIDRLGLEPSKYDIPNPNPIPQDRLPGQKPGPGQTPGLPLPTGEELYDDFGTPVDDSEHPDVPEDSTCPCKCVQKVKFNSPFKRSNLGRPTGAAGTGAGGACVEGEKQTMRYEGQCVKENSNVSRDCASESCSFYVTLECKKNGSQRVASWKPVVGSSRYTTCM